MATQQYTRNRNFRSLTPEQLLQNAYLTIGKEKAEELGFMRTGGTDRNMFFNLDHLKTVEWKTGNVLIKVYKTAVNSSQFEVEGVTQMRHYGGILGVAHVNSRGHGTLSSMIPCIVIADRKSDSQQKLAVNESFADLVGKLKGVEAAEINPASIHLYGSADFDNGTCRVIAVIEASGLFGKCKGRSFHWSVMEHPAESSEAPEGNTEETPRSRRTNRSRSKSVETPSTPADDQPGANADMAGVMADA